MHSMDSAPHAANASDEPPAASHSLTTASAPGAASTAQATGPSARVEVPEDERWEVMWCYVGWYDVADRLERMLPPWAYLKRMVPGTPLSQQASRALWGRGGR